MTIRSEVIPFVLASLITGLLVAVGFRFRSGAWGCAGGIGALTAVVLSGYFLFFFRDPDRTPPADDAAIVAGADGTIASITELREDTYLKTDCVRVSIFLSLFDVHVNRAPIAGQSVFLGYFPGKRYFTFSEKSSEFNQHNKILIEGRHTRCLVHQIVGPVCRRVVYWPAHDHAEPVALGQRIGMMKFGSRLDMYFPKDDIEVLARRGLKVRAGETIIARTRKTAVARTDARDEGSGQ